MIPMNYGDSLDWIESIEDGDRVYIVDFSLEPEYMDNLKGRCDLIWYDHHKSAVEKIDSSIKGERNYDESACKITYDATIRPHLNSNIKQSVDYFISMFSDADNWNDTKYSGNDYELFPIALNLYMNSINTDPNTSEGYSHFMELFENGTINGKDVKACISIGRNIMRYLDISSSKKMRNAFEAKLSSDDTEGQGELNCICYNNTDGSKSFKSIFDSDKHDVMLSFSMNKRNNWDVSFYSEASGPDVSKIAVNFGGGGHHSASGCELNDIKIVDGYIITERL